MTPPLDPRGTPPEPPHAPGRSPAPWLAAAAVFVALWANLLAIVF